MIFRKYFKIVFICDKKLKFLLKKKKNELQRTRNSYISHLPTILVLDAVMIPRKIQILLSQGYSQSLFEDFLLTSTGIG